MTSRSRRNDLTMLRCMRSSPPLVLVRAVQDGWQEERSSVTAVAALSSDDDLGTTLVRNTSVASMVAHSWTWLPC